MSETTVVNLAQTETPVAAPQVAAPVEPPKVDIPKPADDMSAKFAALAKKERIARMLHNQAKQKENALLAREKAIADRERLWEEEFRKSPLEALKRRNLTYQDLTNAALNDGKFQPETEIKSVKDEIERFRQEQANKEARALKLQQQAAQQAESEVIDAFKGKIGQHIEGNGEKYELTKLYDASDLVFQTVDEHFARTKKILSVDEACELVESYLEAELERTAKESKKFKSKFLAAQEAKQDTTDKNGPRSTPTLTNHMNSAIAPSLLSPKTEEDRIQRALARLG